tara:strand:- start:4601 stop:6100 length:1500 start_codon:yes stop_codon:yes gene_type:complete
LKTKSKKTEVILFGDLHNHCNISYAHGSLERAIAFSKLSLDFVSITGHAGWPDMNTKDPSIKHIIDFHKVGFKKLKKNWNKILETIKKEKGIIIYPGYEVHSNKYGDQTIVFKDLKKHELLVDQIDILKKKFKKNKIKNYIFMPHHLSYKQGRRGVNWDIFEEGVSPVVELYSMHGCSENDQAEYPFLHSMGPRNYENTIKYALENKIKLGFIANTDHHSASPGSYGHGRFGVLVKSKNRNSIFKSINERKTFALTGDKIIPNIYLNKKTIGSDVETKKNNLLDINVEGRFPIEYIDIIKNTNLFKRLNCKDQKNIKNEKNISILNIDFGWGERNKEFLWKGEVQFKNIDIITIENKFRGPEIVSPLDKKSKYSFFIPEVKKFKNKIKFKFLTSGNSNNYTNETSGFTILAKLKKNSQITTITNNKKFEILTKDLFKGSVSFNLGEIDTPAILFNKIPNFKEWNFQKKITLPLKKDDNVYIKIKQKNNQICWTSPFFIK